MNQYNSEHYSDPTAAEALANVAREEKSKALKRCVFICSPFAGDVQRNREQARRYLKFAVDKGAIPFAPHLLYPQVMDDNDPAQRKQGLFFGRVWLSKCDEVWVFGSYISSGMRLEIEKASRCRIPIRYFTESCEEVQVLCR